MKYIIVKYETKPDAKSYDDIKPDKYLSKLVLNNGSGYPWKNWSTNLKDSLVFYNKNNAKAVITLLESNSPFIFKIINLE